jgi:hypothetical protein
MKTSISTHDAKYIYEKSRVHSVIAYINKLSKTHFEICGKSEEIYPELKGKNNWDWVCIDKNTKTELAVEVKKITNQLTEEKSSILWALISEVQENINSLRLLVGQFHLSLDFNADDDLHLGIKKMLELSKVLQDTIIEESINLNIGDTRNLIPAIQQKISFTVPESLWIRLIKTANDEQMLTKDRFIITTNGVNFDETELVEFSKLVNNANRQLAIAKPRKALLLLIEEGFRHKDAASIKRALSSLNPVIYKDISQIYYISGNEIEEISLTN